ncbi:MAG: serine/threonine protein phosphatase [Candidatus Omnitrophica bacterium]|nr:serine/threonine protein phosphatase [Candidatus Omnitrophota bacterium]MCM8808979.1 serine/threonine protein phosphatase [Candidatus Omnitrophota bacterium]MCM8833068.1 serine/threonine protein phosphatase [Candidatus Omnitrophota bacterium]
MGKLIELPKKGKCVIVGDTHGDFDTTRIIVKNFINKKNYYLLFLGDYVDRGPKSRENIDYLLSLKEKKENLILLQGNHEMYPIIECSPSDFWENLTQDEFNFYKEKFIDLPLCAYGNGFIALHGALPNVEKLEDIDNIEIGDREWFKIVWGDFKDKEGDILNSFIGRPNFGRDYFFRIMEKLKMNVLVRSHDPFAPERIFQNRCLTIFTSIAYGVERKIAIVNLKKEVKSVDDIEIISLDKPEI